MALWSPELFNLALWLDAADSSAIILSTGVSEWRDKSGNNAHLVQSNSTYRPVYTDTLNGLSVVTFSGGAKHLYNDGGLAYSDKTSLFIVYKRDGSHTNEYNNTTIVLNTGGKNDVSKRDLQLFYTDVSGGTFASTVRTSSTGSTTIDQPRNDSWSIHTATSNRTDGDDAYSINGQDILTASNTAAAFTGTISTLLGCGGVWGWSGPGGVTSFHAPVKIAEVVLIYGDLSDTDRQKVEGYLAWKWGLQANLPVDHLYKSAAPLANYKETVLLDSPVNYWRLGDGVDEHYANVSLLLPMHGDLVDQSSSPKTATNYGSVFSSSASKFYGTSLLLDGINDYVSYPNSTDLEFGSGDFTIEFWFNQTSLLALNTVGYLVSKYGTPRGYSVSLYTGAVSTDMTMNFVCSPDGTDKISAQVAFDQSLGEWVHCAAVRSGDELLLFVRGVRSTPVTFTGSIYATSHALTIGASASLGYFPGYIQDLRITKGVARYTEDFTPPARLSRWAIDEMNQHHLTWTGTPAYGETGAILADSDTAMTLDGSTEYATKNVANYRSTDSQGSIEFWILFVGTAGVIFGSNDTAATANYFAAAVNADGSIYINQRNNSDVADAVFSDVLIDSNVWSHCVITSNGTSYKIYINGREVSTTATYGANTGDWFADTALRDAIDIGAFRRTTVSNYFTGSLDEVAVYDYPLSAAQVLVHYELGSTGRIPYDVMILSDSPVNYWRLGDGVDPYYANVSFLLPMHGDNNGTSFVDQSPTPKTVTRYNAITSTAQNKFYGSSGYFDGNSDYLSVASHTALQLGSGNYTIELYLRIAVFPPNDGNQYAIISKWEGTSGNQRGFLFLLRNVSGTQKLRFIVSIDGSAATNVIDVAHGMVLNTWYHLAIVVNGSTTTAFVNGESIGTGTSVSIFDSTANVLIGAYNPSAIPVGTQFYGHLQDVRITKGVARYTEDFTPPSRLSRWAIDEMNQHHLTWTGTPAYGETGAILADSDTAMLLDGATECASKAVANYRSTDNQGSVEAWINMSARGVIFGSCSGDVNYLGRLLLYISSDNKLAFVLTNNTTHNVITGDDILTLEAWHHVVVTSDGSLIRLYVDAVLQTVTVDMGANNGQWLNDMVLASIGIYIGAQWSGGAPSALFNGSIDEVAVYDYPLSAAQVLAHYGAGIYTIVTSELISILYQEYDLIADIINSLIEQQYSLTTKQMSYVVQVYGIEILSYFVQLYGQEEVITSILNQIYRSNFQLNSYLSQKYTDADQITSIFESNYSIAEQLHKMIMQAYAISGGEVNSMLKSVYDIRNVEEVKKMLLQLYGIPFDMRKYTDSAVFMVDGVEISFISFDIDFNSSSYIGFAGVQLSYEQDYDNIKSLSPAELIVNGESYKFIITSKSKTETSSRSVFSVDLKSQAVLLDFPYASEIIGDSIISGTMSQIVNNAANLEGMSIVWDISVDDILDIDAVQSNGKSPIELIQEIVNELGGIIQSMPDGSIHAMPDYAEDTDKYDVAIPYKSYYIGSEFIGIQEEDSNRDGYNKYIISDYYDNLGFNLVPEKISEGHYTYKAYRSPWTSRSVVLTTSELTNVTIIPTANPVTELIEEEVEVIEGELKLSKTCYGIESIDYKTSANLGSILLPFGEDGSLKTSINGNSILTIKYYTKYWMWDAYDTDSESVQFILEWA